MIKTGDSVILKFCPRTREIKRYNGKVYAYEDMEKAKKFLGPGEKDAILMEYVPAPVRCKECRHSDWAGNSPYCLLHECYMDDDSFCSDGEREVEHGKTD